MTEKRFSCGICGKGFATKHAKNQHRRDAHGKAMPKSRAPKPMTGLPASEVYDFVDAMDLPDGAHWAMIEELSGHEPGDCV